MDIRDFGWKGVYWIDLKERSHLGDVSADGRITTEWVLETSVGTVCTVLI
jgi:hypothetical protein